jgi:Ca-activated chloride channel homolog
MNCENIHPLLTQYLLADLDPSTTDAIQAHLETCPVCQAELELLEPTLALLSDALAEPATAQKRLESTRRKRVLSPSRLGQTLRWVGTSHPKMAVAAGLMFVLGFLWFLITPALMCKRERTSAGYSRMDLDYAIPKGEGTLSVTLCEPEPMEALEDIEEPDSFSRKLPPPCPKPIELEFATEGPLPLSPAAPAPSQDVSVQPAEFDSVAMVKSPVIMKGIYGSRAPAARAEALRRYGDGDSRFDDEDGEEDFGNVVYDVSEALPSAPRSREVASPDTDGDGMSDGWEVTTASGRETPPERVIPVLGDIPLVGRLFKKGAAKESTASERDEEGGFFYRPTERRGAAQAPGDRGLGLSVVGGAGERPEVHYVGGGLQPKTPTTRRGGEAKTEPVWKNYGSTYEAGTVAGNSGAGSVSTWGFDSDEASLSLGRGDDSQPQSGATMPPDGGGQLAGSKDYFAVGGLAPAKETPTARPKIIESVRKAWNPRQYGIRTPPEENVVTEDRVVGFYSGNVSGAPGKLRARAFLKSEDEGKRQTVDWAEANVTEVNGNTAVNVHDGRASLLLMDNRDRLEGVSKPTVPGSPPPPRATTSPRPATRSVAATAQPDDLLVALEATVNDAEDDIVEYQRLHDISRVEARGTMEGRYRDALRSRQNELKSELTLLEGQQTKPGGDDDSKGLREQLAAVESAEYKWQAKADAGRMEEQEHKRLEKRLKNAEVAYEEAYAAKPGRGDFIGLDSGALPDRSHKVNRALSTDGTRAANSLQRQQTLEKLENTLIPDLDFRQANMSDVAAFLASSTLTFGEGPGEDGVGSGKGGAGSKAGNEVSISLADELLGERVTGPDAPLDPFAPDGGNQAGDETLITFSAKDITLKEALDISVDVAGLKYSVDKGGKITIAPKHAAEGQIEHRMYDVPPRVMERILKANGRSDTREDTNGMVDVTDFFTEQGVESPVRPSAQYNRKLGKLIVQNTFANFDSVETVVDALHESAEREKEAAEDPARFKAFGVNPFVKVSEQAFSTFAIDVDTAAYTLGRNYMQKGYLPPAESVRTEEYVNFFDYAYKAPTHETFKVYTDVAPSTFGRGQHLLKIGVKGKRLGREEQRQASLTFLIDTSGSMNQTDRLVLVQKSLGLLVNEMNPDDRVAIVQYDSHARLVLEHTPIANKAAILKAINTLQCGGSTNLEEGMHRAYALAAANFVPKGENRVLLLSDGVANLGSGAAEDILAKIDAFRRQGITCSVFGFGMGSYDDAMLETLANKGDGAYAFIDSEAEARRVFVDDLSATLNTIAADVKIQVEYNPNYVAQYRQIGYENRQLKKQDFRNDTIDAGEVGSGQSVTALYELELAAPARPELYSIARRPNPDVIATVRVRYRRIDTGAVEEIEHRVHQRDILPRFDAASPRFQLAAGIAEFSEILRGSPFAAGSKPADVAAVLRPASLALPLDQHVQELLRLVNGSAGMSRGQ